MNKKIENWVWHYDAEGNRVTNFKRRAKSLDDAMDFENIYIPTSEDEGMSILIDEQIYTDFEI